MNQATTIFLQRVVFGGRLARCFILLDLDHFKGFNDAHGHLAGDEVLRKVGDVLRSCVRGLDRVYRYGGEEFLVLLAGDDRPPATEVADRVRRAVSALAIGHPANDGWDRVTLSAGVALRPPGRGTPLSDSLHAADQAMFEAKRGGRNRVAISGDARLSADDSTAHMLRSSVA